MYGLPEDFDGSFFVGRTLQTVVFSQCMVELIFDGNTSIGIQSSYECQLAMADHYLEKQQVELPIVSSRLMQLLGHKVASVEADKRGTLALHFEEGHVFRCFDDDTGYESYQIGHGTTEYFV